MSSPSTFSSLKKKPSMTWMQIFNMSFGFFGIQFGFALQNSNASGILRTYGADVHNLSWFWLAAPLVGLIVQPIVGHYSDKTWTSFGRRRPYILAGSILSAGALMLLPNANILGNIAPLVIIGAGFLMIMDACFNLAMEPFRALVADNLSPEQHTTGFAVQTALIGGGAVIGSILPFILSFFVSSEAPEGVIADNLKYAFYIGSVCFLISVLWTVFKTKEFNPTDYKAYHGETQEESGWNILRDFRNIPKTMRQLGVVQFFSWFALFGMWVFTTDTIATHVMGLDPSDSSSKDYRDVVSWTGVIFSVYNGVSAIYALFLPKIAAKIGRKKTHAMSLVIGAIGLISIYFIKDKTFLLFSMVLVGIAWASILAMPYVILASSLPAGKMGLYIGIFNFFITLPQILNAIIGGPMVKTLFNGQPVYALILAGVCFLISAIAVMRVYDPGEKVKEELV